MGRQSYRYPDSGSVDWLGVCRVGPGKSEKPLAVSLVLDDANLRRYPARVYRVSADGRATRARSDGAGIQGVASCLAGAEKVRLGAIR